MSAVRLAAFALFAVAARATAAGYESLDKDMTGYLQLDRLEYRGSTAGHDLAWEVKGWFGNDLGRMWLRSEGARADDGIEAADVELLYGFGFSTWWDVVGGIREDFRPGDPRIWLGFGVQGLAPQRFDIAFTIYTGESKQSAAHFDAGYQLPLTNRLILQPALDLWLYGRDDAAHGIGSGFATAEAGLRLHYEFARRCAPYVGIEYERAFAITATLRRQAGIGVAATRYVLGLRAWL